MSAWYAILTLCWLADLQREQERDHEGPIVQATSTRMPHKLPILLPSQKWALGLQETSLSLASKVTFVYNILGLDAGSASWGFIFDQNQDIQIKNHPPPTPTTILPNTKPSPTCLQNGIPVFLCNINNLPSQQPAVLRLLWMKAFCPLFCEQTL